MITIDMERAQTGETTLKLMKALGYKPGDMVQSIKICIDIEHQFPYAEITRLIDSKTLKEIYNLVDDARKMVDVPVAEPTHHYEFKVKNPAPTEEDEKKYNYTFRHKDALPEQTRVETNMTQVWPPVKNPNEKYVPVESK